MRLAERDLKQLAAATGSNEKAIHRLLGSLRIKIPSSNESALTGPREIDLGLRLQNGEVLSALFMARGKDATLQTFEEALRGYFSSCPTVCAWIGRGDFDPDAVPAHISKAGLLHACRSAGRLRAKVMRA